MKSLRRALLAVALAAWVALPGVGSDGGENAGGTGVWILPRAIYVTGSSAIAPAPRETRVLQAPLSTDVTMLMSEDVGSAVATFVESTSAVPVALPVSGLQVRIPANLLQALAQSPDPRADIVVTDAGQVGYVIEIVVDPHAGTATIRVQ